MVKKFMEMAAPSVDVFRDIYFFKASSLSMMDDIDKKIAAKEAFDPEFFSDLSDSFYYSYEKIWRSKCIQWNFVEKPEDKEYVWSTLITNDELVFYKNGFTIKTGADTDTVLMFIGGGGFISSTEKLQELFLRGWAKDLKISVWEFHYKLAPAFKYPY